MRKTTKDRAASEVHPRFASVVEAFARDRRVKRQTREGFGSGALKVKGKIFAMMSSKGQLVVKLSKERVDELVGSGKGQRFDPGHGRLMKEWVALGTARVNWVELAREAFDFVKRGNS